MIWIFDVLGCLRLQNLIFGLVFSYRVSALDEVFPVDEEPMELPYKSPDQLVDRFLTLSLLPEYRWKNLGRQDLIRERNKPKEALKIPEKAPFFLPTIPGLEPTFDLTPKETSLDTASVKKSSQLISGPSAFMESLSSPTNYLRPFDLLAVMSISQIEAELRGLAPEAGGSVDLEKAFARCLLHALDNGKNQELVHSYLELFLKLHVGTLSDQSTDGELSDLFSKLRDLVGVSVKRIEDLLDQSLNVVLFLKHVAL